MAKVIKISYSRGELNLTKQKQPRSYIIKMRHISRIAKSIYILRNQNNEVLRSKSLQSSIIQDKIVEIVTDFTNKKLIVDIAISMIENLLKVLRLW